MKYMIFVALLLVGCATQTSYQTIAATEAAVLAANGAYLDGVVTGKFATNGVPAVEAAFNDTQLTLHAAAAIASNGSSAVVPAPALAKAANFTNIVTSASHK